MKIKDYELYCKGYNEKLKHERLMFKMLSGAIAAAKTGQYPVKSAMEFWGDEPEQGLSIEEIRVAKAKAKQAFKKIDEKKKMKQSSQ